MVKLILEPLDMPNMRLTIGGPTYIECSSLQPPESTLQPHRKLTEHGRYFKQNIEMGKL